MGCWPLVHAPQKYEEGGSCFPYGNKMPVKNYGCDLPSKKRLVAAEVKLLEVALWANSQKLKLPALLRHSLAMTSKKVDLGPKTRNRGQLSQLPSKTFLAASCCRLSRWGHPMSCTWNKGCVKACLSDNCVLQKKNTILRFSCSCHNAVQLAWWKRCALSLSRLKLWKLWI